MCYNCGDAYCEFKVDTEKFTESMANDTLTFFTWEYGYDEEADPIDEVMKKYAMEVIFQATSLMLSAQGVKFAFESKEGFCPIDGTKGIELISVDPYQFNENELEFETNAA